MWCVFVPDFDIEKCFLRDDVQQILKRVTGFDLNKIFRERKIDKLKPPEYKLLTTEQLEEVLNLPFVLHVLVKADEYMLCVKKQTPVTFSSNSNNLGSILTIVV